MSLLLGNLRELIGDRWDGSDLPAPDAVGVVDTDEDGEDDYVVAPRE